MWVWRSGGGVIDGDWVGRDGGDDEGWEFVVEESSDRFSASKI